MNLIILQSNSASQYAADDYKTVAVLSNSSSKSCPFFDDLRTEKLEDFYDTYEFSVPSYYEEAQFIVSGNYVIFRDESAKYRLFRIYDVEDSINGGVHIKRAYCENAFVPDLLKTLVPRADLGDINFKDAFAHCLSNSGWQIGKHEYLGELINKSFDGTTTAQAEIQAICKDYRGEIDAYVELNEANKIIGKYFDLVEKRGDNRTGRRFEYRRDLKGATRKMSDADLYTAVKGKGKDGITIGEMNNGSATLYDEAANDLYNGGREYLVKFVEYSEIETPSALYAAMYEELKNCSKPKYEYTTDVALLELSAGYDEEDTVLLGDTVKVIDFEMTPELTVSARVIEKQTSFTDKTKNVVVLGEYIEVVNTTPDDIKKLQSNLTTISNGLQPVYRIEIRASAGTVARNGYLQTTGEAILEAVVYKDNVRITGDKSQYVWEKVYRKTGVHDTAWEKENQNAGDTVKVTGEDYAKNCDFYCHFLDDSYNFVATNYFKLEVDNVVNEIEKLKEEGYAIIVNQTDSHYAIDSLVNATSKARALDHMKNAVEITHQTDCDLMTHTGDLIDGITSKSMAMANLQAAINVLNSCDCPVMVCKGNHDDNMIGDNRLYGQLGEHVIEPNEMFPIMTTNYLRRNIEYNSNDNAIYSYYDIEDKNLRVICLDCFDFRYDLRKDDKTPKYQTRTHKGFQQKQLKWLSEVLEATPVNYGVVFFSHVSFGGVYASDWKDINDEAVRGIINAWQEGGVYDSSTMKEKNADHPVNIQVDYSGRGKGKLMAIFAGHVHKDRSKVANFGNAPTILINCSYSAGDNDDAERRTIGTVKEELFDTICINVEKNTIKLIRFGQFVEGEGRVRTFTGGAN